MNRFLCATTALLLTAGLASAQCNYRPITYYQTQQHYGHYQHVQQVQHYSYPVQKVVAHDVAVAPLYVTVPVEVKAVPVQYYAAPYYYSYGEAYREKANLRDVIREELRSALGQDPKDRPAPQRAPQRGHEKPPDGSGRTETPPSGPDDDTPAELQAKVLTAYQGKGSCLSCHGDSGANKFKLATTDGQGTLRLLKQPPDKRWKIYGMSSSGVMPPAAQNDADKAMEVQHLPTLLEYAAQK
jgi:mono/diheme cytochrome c family protein